MTLDAKKKFIIDVAFVVTAYGVLYFIFKYVIHWIMPFLIGFLIALALRPITRVITSRFKRIKGKSVALFVIAMFYVIVALILWFLISFLWEQITELIMVLPSFYFAKLEPILFNFNDWVVERTSMLSPELSATISEILMNGLEYVANLIRSLSLYLVQLAKNILSNFPLYLISVIFTIVLSVFISVEYDNLTKFLKKQFSEEFYKTFEQARKFLSGTLWKMIKAYIIILFITFIELFVGLSLLKMRFALPIAAIVAVLDIMPILGTGGVLIPWAIIELILENYTVGLGLLLLYLIVTIVRNTIEPRIVGHQIGLHPIITITVMYAGLRLFGFIGFLIAPIIAILVKYLNDNGKIHLFK